MTTATEPAAGLSAAELGSIGAAVADALPGFLADLEHLVNIDCGSYTKAGVDEVGRWVGSRMEQLGATIEVRDHATLGATVIGTFEGTPGAGPRLLLLGHMDTVFDPGTAAERPFRVENGIATGPGVTDMKAGLLTGLYALDAVRRLGAGLPFERVVFIANPDEEIGSTSSRPHIEAAAASVDVCLSLECARANGDIVSARKGMEDLRLTVRGRAAHAGVEPEKGRNAIVEAARLVREVQALNGRWPGVTTNVGVIGGGTRPNVVAEHCSLEIDLRATTRANLEAVRAAIAELTATTLVPDVTITTESMGSHWPMEKLERSGRLIDHAVAIAGRLGFELHDASTGGVGDANTTSGLGVPTIDGLGPIGGNDHAPAEYLEVASIVPRTALLAGLLLAIGRDPVVASWRGS